MNTAQKETQKSVNDFESNCRDLLACMKDSKETILERTAAAASLDKNVREDLAFFSTDLDQTNVYSRDIARAEFRKTVYAAIAKAFCNLLANGTLRQAIKLTDEGDSQLLELKYLSGLEQRPAPAPVVPVMSYDDQIRWDWENRPFEEIKKKKAASAQYRKRLAELLDGDTIKSQATTLHNGANL